MLVINTTKSKYHLDLYLNIMNDDPMVNCISQPIKLDDLILITEPRSLTEMGDVSHQTNETKPISFGFFLYFSARSI